MFTSDDEAGITLVEIVIALLILGFVLTTFFVVLTNSLQSFSDSRARQTSSQQATEVIEQLRSLSSSQIAMYNDPLVTETSEFDPNSVSCGGTPGQYDPDGGGPLGCEVVATSDQGAITSDLPFQGQIADELPTITTIATAANGPNVPDGTVRVTVILDFSLPNGPETVRRSALFSEVSRG